MALSLVRESRESGSNAPFFSRFFVLVLGLQKLPGGQAAKPLRLFVDGAQELLEGCFHLRAEGSIAGGSFGDFGAELPDPVVEAARWHSTVKGSARRCQGESGISKVPYRLPLWDTLHTVEAKKSARSVRRRYGYPRLTSKSFRRTGLGFGRFFFAILCRRGGFERMQEPQ